MNFYMPTKIYSESHCIEKHGDIFAQYGKNAMIITGKHSSKANGSLEAVTAQLDFHDINYMIFDDIEENPSIETVMKARDIGISEAVDFVIGIGGGSPMDAAKAIALMIANPEKTADALYEKEDLSWIPVIEVPTTAGTGSEVTPWSVLTIHAKRTKKSISHAVYPAAALIDAGYLKTASRTTLVSTAVDTLAHLVESHLITKSTDYSRVFSEKGLRLWGSFKERLLTHTLTDADYESMMQACTLGGIAITHTSTGLPHALSYTFTYELGIAHGAACGYTLGGFVKYYANPDRADEVLSALGFNTPDEFCTYLNQLLGKPEIPKQLWENNVKAMMNNPDKLATCPYPIDEETLSRFLTP